MRSRLPWHMVHSIAAADQSAYGAGQIGRTRPAPRTQGATAVKSDIVFISSTVATDVSTARGTSTQAWLTSALEATLADDSTRADFTGGASNLSYTKGRTATGIIAYETTRGGSNTRMYIVDNGAQTDRLLVGGSRPIHFQDLFDDDVWLAAPMKLREHSTIRAESPCRRRHRSMYCTATPPATVDDDSPRQLIMTAESPCTGSTPPELSSTLMTRTFALITGRRGGNRAILAITADLDVDTGRLTSSDGIEFRNGNDTDVRSNTEVFARATGSHGFAGQVYGNEAQSIGGVFWGVQTDFRPCRLFW